MRNPETHIIYKKIKRFYKLLYFFKIILIKPIDKVGNKVYNTVNLKIRWLEIREKLF